MHRWLVTGGVGFIGYHVCRALLGRGERVVIVDDFSDAPYPRVYKRRNFADLEREFGTVPLAEVCVTDRPRVEPLFEGVDGVIHLAGLAGVRPSFSAPARYARVNVEGTATLLELARAAKVRNFVFASSSSVYGNSTPLPAREEAAAVVPESPYAATKRAAELLAQSYCRIFPELSCTALRFFTVYGPRQRPEMAITLFTRALLAGEPITIFGDGSMRRDFTHVDDIVRGVLAAADRPRPGFRPYNLGSGSPIELSSLVRAISETASVRADLRYTDVPAGDVDATFADIAKARGELDWTPRIPLREGLVSVLDWVKNNA